MSVEQMTVPPPPHLDELPEPTGTSLRTRIQPLIRWESALVILVIGTGIMGSQLSPAFLRSSDFFYMGLNIGEIAIMSLPLALIVITGEIDLSVGSTLGLTGTILGYTFAHGWPIALAIAAAMLTGVVCGFFNGFLVTRVGLPSIAVTIGTLTLYSGIAQIILPGNAVGGFPSSLTKIGIDPIPGTQIPYSIGFFIFLAIVVGVVLHAAPVGRSIFAIGANKEAAFFSGIRVKRIKMGLYIMSGTFSALAGVLWTFRFASARYDAGTGLELDCVAIVLLGGVSIFGGKGTIIGVVLGVCVLGGVQQALTLDLVSAQSQNIVTGGLLIGSVVVPNLTGIIRSARARTANILARRTLRHATELGS